jgi:hypothetical protein
VSTRAWWALAVVNAVAGAVMFRDAVDQFRAGQRLCDLDTILREEIVRDRIAEIDGARS